jgi:dolichol-phosphate mannosyltransferase
MRLGVVVPLANEEASLDAFLPRVLAQLGAGDGVFCVIDNVSRDRTRGVVEGWQQRESRVRLVWAPENRCVVDAYFRGYRAALDAGCRWVLEMDGGLSHLPEEIPQFIRAMQAGHDYVAGCRFIPGGGYRGNWRRYLISKGGSVLTNLLLGTRMRDMTGGFECFSRRALEMVVERGVRSRAHFFQTEIKVMMHALSWTEVPIHYSNPSSRVGGASLREAFRNLWHLYRRQRDAYTACRGRPPWRSGKGRNSAGQSRNATEGVPYRARAI